MIHLTIEDAASVVGILVVFWGMLKFGLTSPLETAIKELRQSIQQLNRDNQERDAGIKRILDRIHDHDTKLALHEERIEKLEGDQEDEHKNNHGHD